MSKLKLKNEDRTKLTREKTFRTFEPDNLEGILGLPFKKKTLGKYKRAVKQLKYALHSCYLSQFMGEKDGNVNLSYHAMSAIVKGDKHTWKELSSFLVSNGILECDFESRVGVKAFTYWLSDGMKQRKWKLSDRPESFDLLMPLKEVPPNVKLSVDLEYLMENLNKIAEKREWKGNESEVYKWLLTEGFDTSYTIARTGRIFGVWNSVPNELRGVFTIDGETCVEPDISNANPLFLSCLYLDMTATKARDSEKEKYVALVESGLFYEDVMEKMGMDNRDEVKQQILSFICGGGKRFKAIGEYLAQEFPMLFTQIMAIRGKNYKALSDKMQKIESGIIVERICNEFDCLSIHDGVLAKESEGEAIKARLKEIIKEELGVDASIKIEDKRKGI